MDSKACSVGFPHYVNVEHTATAGGKVETSSVRGYLGAVLMPALPSQHYGAEFYNGMQVTHVTSSTLPLVKTMHP